MAEDLWPQFLRVVADAAPWVVFAENVTRGAIDAAADDLASLGFQVKCMGLSAADMGADHIRQRYWLLAHADMRGELLASIYAKAPGSTRVHPRVWEAYPDEPRVADGLANRMERLVATGNGQVPVVAAAAFIALAAEFD